MYHTYIGIEAVASSVKAEDKCTCRMSGRNHITIIAFNARGRLGRHMDGTSLLERGGIEKGRHGMQICLFHSVGRRTSYRQSLKTESSKLLQLSFKNNLAIQRQC